MLRSIKELHGYNILATDGEIGHTHTFYFDDLAWIVRYLVVDTGTWLPGRRVLIAPLALGQPDWITHVMPVNLTRDQVENSPPIDLDLPVSRQMEERLHEYYGWPPYWHSGTAALAAAKAAREGQKPPPGDPHLRSTREVIGYHIQATDGEIGHVEDFVGDVQDWTLRYMVVDTRNWLPGRKVLVAPTWIERVNWAQEKVHVDLGRETIKNSPEYDPSAPINREYEAQLYDYYGRPVYWT